ncbi:MAG: hypothetical protein JSW46_09170 [Gemmatimonadota bacterium]|nr:MAG: hypothetical protein JSW46_09170 [Gemmatimonadota bacterium]
MTLQEHRIDARGLALEGLVIVASILAAFALDRWWDDRRERVEERVTLAALQDEFLQARAELELYLRVHRRIEGSVRSTVDALRSGLDRGVSFVSIPDTALAWAYIPPTTQLSLGTLSGLLQSGRLGILQDPELRTALSGWAGMLGDLTEEETRSLEYVQYQLDPVLRKRVDVTAFVSNKLIGDLAAGNLPQAVVDGESRIPVDLET